MHWNEKADADADADRIRTENNISTHLCDQHLRHKNLKTKRNQLALFTNMLI